MPGWWPQTSKVWMPVAALPARPLRSQKLPAPRGHRLRSLCAIRRQTMTIAAQTFDHGGPWAKSSPLASILLPRLSRRPSPLQPSLEKFGGAMSIVLPTAAPAGQSQGFQGPIHPCPTLREPDQGTTSKVPLLHGRSRHLSPISHSLPRCPWGSHSSPSKALHPHALWHQMFLPNSGNPRSTHPNADCSKAGLPKCLSMWRSCQKGAMRWSLCGLWLQRHPNASDPRSTAGRYNCRRPWTPGLPSAGPNANGAGRRGFGLTSPCTSMSGETRKAALHPTKVPLGLPMPRLAMRPWSRHVSREGCRQPPPPWPAPKPATACAWMGWEELVLKWVWIP